MWEARHNIDTCAALNTFVCQLFLSMTNRQHLRRKKELWTLLKIKMSPWVGGVTLYTPAWIMSSSPKASLSGIVATTHFGSKFKALNTTCFDFGGNSTLIFEPSGNMRQILPSCRIKCPLVSGLLENWDGYCLYRLQHQPSLQRTDFQRILAHCNCSWSTVFWEDLHHDCLVVKILLCFQSQCCLPLSHSWPASRASRSKNALVQDW